MPINERGIQQEVRKGKQKNELKVFTKKLKEIYHLSIIKLNHFFLGFYYLTAMKV